MIVLNKPLGKTPLECIQILRELRPEHKDSILGYAGRLDPMAAGVLIVLVDGENKERKRFERLEKVYTCRVLFGIATDTYDLMGRITAVDFSIERRHIEQKLVTLLPTFVGTYDQAYPPYSAVLVQGKPLYYWARKNKLKDLSIPTKRITISSLALENIERISSTELLAHIDKYIPNVTGDFRQNDIVTDWHKTLDTHPGEFVSVEFTISCSSGTYIRSIAHELGKTLGIPSVTQKLIRTRVGKFTLEESLVFE